MSVSETKIDLRQTFPDLSVVRDTLHPYADYIRPTIDEYEIALAARGELSPAVKDAIDKARLITAQTRAVGYIAGPLTGIDEETKLRYGVISDFLGGYSQEERVFFGYVPHLHGTDPVKHPSVTHTEVRHIDFLWAGIVADFHINFLNPPAHGNAIEEGWAEKGMIPVVYLNPKGNKLSRLTLGMENIDRQIDYDNFSQDGIEYLKLFTDELAAWLKMFPKRDPREFFYRSTGHLSKPAEIMHGLDPKRFNLVYPIGQFLIYIKNPNHPRYGEVGEIGFHDWRDGGMGVRFSDGSLVQFRDDSGDLSFWVK